jgi:hypothetical protein
MESNEPDASALDQELVLYVWDELPAAQRLALDQKISSDPALRNKVEALRATQGVIATGFAALDQVDSIDVRLHGIDRTTTRMMRQWQVDRLTRKPDAPGVARTRFRRVPLWMFPLSAAAAVLLVLGVWSLVLQNGSDSPSSPSEIVRGVDDTEGDVSNAAGEDGNSPGGQFATASWNPLSGVDNSGEIEALDRDFARLEVLHYTLR